MKSSSILICALWLVACGEIGEEGTATSSNDTDTSSSGSTMTGGATLTSPATTTLSTTDPGTSSTNGSGSETSEPDTTSGEPSSSSEGSTGGDPSSSGDTGATDDTIYEIQDGTIAEGTDVDVQGVIITGLFDQIGMFVQEPDGGEYSGVYVDTGTTDLTALAIGDEVDITGVTSEGNGTLTGLTAIDASNGTIVPTGETGQAPDPELVPLADLAAPGTAEPWEGVLVIVEEDGNLSVTDEEFEEFLVEDSGDAVLVDNFLYNVYDEPETFPNFGVGAQLASVTGPLNFTYDAFKIAPRSADDLPGYVEP
jgi:hypothetical protein